MTASLLFEISKVSRRTLAVVVSIAAILIALSLTGIAMSQADALDAGATSVAAATRAVVSMGFTGVLFATLMGAFLITSEERSHTMSATFLLNPNRREVLQAKATVAAALGLAIGVISNGLAVLLTFVALDRFGHEPEFTMQTWTMVIASVVVTAVAGPWGLAIGTFVRTSVAATAVIVIWTTMLEAAIITITPAVGKFLPGGAQAGVIRFTEDVDALGRVAASGLLMVYVAAALVLADRAVRTREVQAAK